MAQHTVTVRELVHSGFELWKFGTRPWPIFDERYRTILEEKITRYYYEYEIAPATPAEFKSMLHTLLFVHMPYYNKLYESTLFKIQPLYNHLIEEDIYNKSRTIRDTKETQDQTVDNTKDTTGNTGVEGTGTSRSVEDLNRTTDSDKQVETNEIFHDTPEGKIDLHNTDYATTVTLREGDEKFHEDVDQYTTKTGNTTDTQKIDTSENSVWEQILNDIKTGQFETNIDGASFKRAKGVINTNQSKLLLDYRDTLRNIDLEIIEVVRPCFNNVWIF